MDDIRTITSVIALFLSLLSLQWSRRRPKLEVTYEDKSPFKKHAQIIETWESSVFVRVRVRNRGSNIAKGCTGKVVSWCAGKEETDDFDPVRVHWVSNPPDDDGPISLAVGEFEYLDVFRVNIGGGRLDLYTNSHPRATSMSFAWPQAFVLKVVVYCEDSPASSIRLRVSYDEKNNPIVQCIKGSPL
ncbi:hypothetical protein BJP37_02410 [Moorena bouillonii PNG]|uniref:Uncharacterized protein n=1 Tax=Moorena bouillonii PNG TaxID=568701 RepID=A0A1U7MWM8_9CYAN|nr:hypothetical protein BJP37_02410 [Moorena bouillonii PNG]